MSKAAAHRILDAVLAGADIPEAVITAALIATGDLCGHLLRVDEREAA